jgi:hypothetical protein
LGWTRDRYLHATIEEVTEAIRGYWRNWERQRVWMVREIIFAMIQGNANIPNENKPKRREEIYKLSDDKKEVEKKPKIKPEDIKFLEKIKFGLTH